MTSALLVTIDSLRADHVGCYGYDRDTTPVIDDLAASSAVFENTFAHACSTRPSFPSILTSSYPLMYGGYEQISEERTLISEVFDEAGYRTGGFHSNAYLNAEFGYERGWNQYFDSTTDPGMTARLRQYVKSRLDKNGFMYKTLAGAFDRAERTVGASVGSAYVDADEITDHAIDWVKANDDQDQFLWVHYMDVHHPYVPPNEYQLEFRDNPIDDRRAIKLRRKFIEDPDDITDEELADIIDLYDAEIRFTDAEIGRLLDAVHEQWDDSTIVVTADHGEEFLDHGQFSHHATFYDEVLHVPLVVNDGKHEGQYQELVGLLDVAPTLVDAAGLELPDNFYGHSLLALLAEDEWTRTEIFCDWASEPGSDRLLAYRDTNWKYIKRPDGEELFDLKEDPREQTNLIAERTDIAEELREKVQQHERELDDTQTNVEQVEMDETVRQQLRDLGYKE